LHESGFGRGERLALALPEGPEMAVAVLALTACATCVPLNPALDEASYRIALERLSIDALIVGEDDSPAARAAATLGIPILLVRWRKSDPAGVFTPGRNDLEAAPGP
jgi:acyl-CoA synthetase (AMP-forming)/AMP-acid ligase II